MHPQRRVDTHPNQFLAVDISGTQLYTIIIKCIYIYIYVYAYIHLFIENWIMIVDLFIACQRILKCLHCTGASGSPTEWLTGVAHNHFSEASDSPWFTTRLDPHPWFFMALGSRLSMTLRPKNPLAWIRLDLPTEPPGIFRVSQLPATWYSNQLTSLARLPVTAYRYCCPLLLVKPLSLCCSTLL